MEILKKIKEFRWIYRSEQIRVCKFTGNIEYKNISNEWTPIMTEEYYEFLQEELNNTVDIDENF